MGTAKETTMAPAALLRPGQKSPNETSEIASEDLFGVVAPKDTLARIHQHKRKSTTIKEKLGEPDERFLNELE